MTAIKHEESRTVTWACVLCLASLSMTESATYDTLVQVCSCGKVYNVTFGSAITIEEDASLENIFTIQSNGDSIEVRLAWNGHKGTCKLIKEGETWNDALHRAIGHCWRRYSDEIVQHIREDAKA